jgi:hypothetical protein
MKDALRCAAAGFGLPSLLLAGCGMIAAPQPPSLKLPDPVTDLTAQRTGNEVTLHWTMPKRTTDKVLLKGNQKVRVCRRLDTDPCTDVGDVLFAPQKPADFTDHLSAALTSGPSRPLNYTVELENHAGRTAGPSNTAITIAGAAPSVVADLQAQVQPDGIVLSWTPTNPSGLSDKDQMIRIERKLLQPSGAPKTTVPLEQTLEYSGPDQGHILDRDAALDHVYTYTVQRIAKLMLQDKSFEVASAPSATVTINARNVFPPAVPVGLQAIADPEARAIDLSWQPNTEADLAGYTVYRREAGSSAAPDRLSQPAQAAPSFRDTNVQPGHTYEYSVSALDHDGNESARSPEVEESLPQQ